VCNGDENECQESIQKSQSLLLHSIALPKTNVKLQQGNRIWKPEQIEALLEQVKIRPHIIYSLKKERSHTTYSTRPLDPNVQIIPDMPRNITFCAGKKLSTHLAGLTRFQID
jgi:hypothetical protein